MQERLLVYGYMSNGSLHDWLHVVEDKAKMLEWPIRVKIIVGIAGGLISTFGEAMFMNRNDIDLNKG